MNTQANFISITGNTYPVKDALKSLGARWNGEEKAWQVPAEVADQAQALVAKAPRPAARRGGFPASPAPTPTTPATTPRTQDPTRPVVQAYRCPHCGALHPLQK